MTPMHERPLVYLAGPYTNPDPIENTHNTVQIAATLADGGIVTPFIPHLTLLFHAITPRPLEFWYEYDLSVLARCDAVLRLPGASTGADREVEYAQAKQIPVFHDSDALLNYFSGVS